MDAGQVTISHGPVEALGWPAITMGFTPASEEILEGVDIGDPVAFEFTQEGEEYVLTPIRKDRWRTFACAGLPLWLRATS